MEDQKASLRTGPMRRRTRVFLYGHYDSRGGTMAVEAPDRATADRIYATDFSFDSEAKPEDYASLIKEDFLTEATLEGPLPDGADGVDLEWELYGAVFLKAQASAELMDGGCRIQKWPADVELLYVPVCDYETVNGEDQPRSPEGYVHPRWDDDAISFVFLRAE